MNLSKINLGSGYDIKEGYLNVDHELKDPRIFNADMLDLPKDWTDQADEILCDGALEHIGINDIPKALREILRVLKPGGTARFIVPDLEYVCEMYYSAKDDTVLKNWAIFMLYGLQSRPGQFHRCGFSAKSFRNTLEGVGFTVKNFCYAWQYTQKVLWTECTK